MYKFPPILTNLDKVGLCKFQKLWKTSPALPGASTAGQIRLRYSVPPCPSLVPIIGFPLIYTSIHLYATLWRGLAMPTFGAKSIARPTFGFDRRRRSVLRLRPRPVTRHNPHHLWLTPRIPLRRRLKLDVWSFSGAWMLVLGAFTTRRPRICG